MKINAAIKALESIGFKIRAIPPDEFAVLSPFGAEKEMTRKNIINLAKVVCLKREP